MRPSMLLVAVAVLVGTVACTDSRTGTARPGQTPTGTGSQPTTTSTNVSLPPRPRSLPLDGVGPCSLLTEQQLAAFSIDQAPRPDDGDSSGPLKGVPGCHYSTSVGSANEWRFLITPATKLGLAEYLAQLQDNPTRRSIQIGGFPAVREEQQFGPGNDACYADVDVADGQMLAVQFSQVAAKGDKILPMETLCAKAVEVAEAALTTLQAQR